MRINRNGAEFTRAQAFIEERKYPQAIGVLSEIADSEAAEDQLEQLRYLISGDYLENLQMGVAAIDRDGHVPIAVNPIYHQSMEEIAGWKDIKSLSGGLCGLNALDMEGKICAYSQYTDYMQSDAISQKMAGQIS